MRVVYDATLLLQWGLASPVGIVRVEHYVAEFLLRDVALALRFVTFDRMMGRYRATSRDEDEKLRTILLDRYATRRGDGSDGGQGGATAKPVRPREPAVRGRNRLRRMLSRFQDPQEEFDQALSLFLQYRIPVNQRHAFARVAVRIIRSSVAVSLRAARATAALPARLRDLARVDVGAPPTLLQSQHVIPQHDVLGSGHVFSPGDTLLILSNAWDYVNYDELWQIRRQQVRIVAALYDVVALDLPHTTPGDVHVYHRFWTELAHMASEIVAISQATADAYARLVAGPLMLDTPCRTALLPNFLRERAEQIGATPTHELEGVRFVVYCSTLEPRKNHVTLLAVWERLRRQLPAQDLPILVLVGRWGWSVEATKLMVERNWRLRPFTRVIEGASDAELIWLYRHALFTVFPSLGEGFGLAAAESLSFGTPVIVADDPALREATEHLMPAIDPLDAPSWERELLRLILDNSYLDGLRAAAGRFRGAPYDAFARAIRDAATGASHSDPDARTAEVHPCC